MVTVYWPWDQHTDIRDYLFSTRCETHLAAVTDLDYLRDKAQAQGIQSW